MIKLAKSRSFKGDSLLIFLSQFGNALISFIGTAYFGRVLGASVFGDFVVLLAWAMGLGILISLGINEAVMKRLGECSDDKANQLISSALVVKAITWLIFGLVAVSLKFSIYLVFFVFLVDFFDFFILRVLVAQNKMMSVALLPFLLTFVNYILGIFLVMNGFGFEALVWSFLFGYMLTSILAVLAAGFKLAWPRKCYFKELFSFSKFSWSYQLTSSATEWLPATLLKTFASSASVGIFAVAYRISSLSSLTLNAVGAVIYPRISGKKMTSFAVVRKGISAVSIVPIGMFFGSLVLASDIMRIGFGEEFVAGAMALTLLFLFRLFYTWNGLLSRVYLAMDKPAVSAFIFLLSFFALLSLGWLAIDFGGIEGLTAWLTLLALLGFIGHYGGLKVRLPFSSILFYIVSGAVMALVISFWPVNSLLDLVLVTIVGAVLYLSLIYAAHRSGKLV